MSPRLFALLAVLVISVEGLAVNWAKAWHAAGLYNSTAPAKLRGPKPVGSYKVCPGTYMAQNFVPVVTPDAAKAGDNVKTAFDYDLTEEILDSPNHKATYAVTYNFIPFTPTVDSLCADQETDKCPLAAAHHHSESFSVFPSGLSGTLVSKITWTHEDGRKILCMEWTVKV